MIGMQDAEKHIPCPFEWSIVVHTIEVPRSMMDNQNVQNPEMDHLSILIPFVHPICTIDHNLPQLIPSQGYIPFIYLMVKIHFYIAL